MASKLKFFGPQYKALAMRKTVAMFNEWWVELQRIARQDASKQNTGVRVKITRPRPGGNKTSRTIFPDSSQPGEPPRRRSGVGQREIVAGFNRGLMVARVGYSAKALYMIYHELGIRYPSGEQQRPTIIPAQERNEAHLLAVMKAAADRTS